MATYTGGEGNDTITGGNGTDIIRGRFGDDIVKGLLGGDSIDGGAGSDTLSGGGGNDTIHGGYASLDDRDFIDGGDGDDVIQSRGLATLDGGAGNDQLSGSGFALIEAGAGDDVVAAGYDPSFKTSSSYLRIDGGTGFDTFRTSGQTLASGFNLFSIVSGFERFVLHSEKGSEAFLLDINIPESGTLFIDDDDWDASGHSIDASQISVGNLNVSLAGHGTVMGGARGDRIAFIDTHHHTAGSYDRSVVHGNAGDDEIFTRGSTDTLVGGEGNDFLDGGDGMDTAVYTSSFANYAIVELRYNTFLVTDLHGSDGADTIVDINKLQFADRTIDVVIRGLEIIGDETGEDIGGGAESDHLDGAGGNDTLVGNGGHDHIEGGSGRDSVSGGRGNDLLAGDAGHDSLQGGSGDDIVLGHDGNDVLNGDSGTNTLVGGAGNDTYIVASAGDVITESADGGIDTEHASFTDVLDTGLENLVLTGSSAINGTGNSAANILSGNASSNILDGASGSDRLDGGAGHDTLQGGTGKDTLLGGAGNDSLTGGTGTDSLAGGTGNDIYVIDSSSDVITESVDGGVDTLYSTVNTTLATNVENLTLLGGTGRQGTGNALDNRLTGSNGADLLQGGAGDDQLAGGAGNDSLRGGDGADTVTYADATASITVDLATGVANGSSIGTDAISQVERVVGSAFADTIIGSAAADRLNGASGADTMSGGAGSDTYYVDNAGDKVIESRVDAGGVDRVYSYLTHAGKQTYTLGAFVEDAAVRSATTSNLTGNALDNVLHAGAGVNRLDGGEGADTVSFRYATSAGTQGVALNLGATDGDGYAVASGISGADRIIRVENIIGSDYADTLTGNAASNRLSGLAGKDVMKGQGGADTFVFSSTADSASGATRDVIRDFSSNDVIDLKAIDANELVGGNQTFSAAILVGSFGAGSFRPADVGKLFFDAGTMILYGNTDADAAAEFSIQVNLVGISTITSADLML